MSRTDHPRMSRRNGRKSHRALTKYQRYYWEAGYSEPRGWKMLHWILPDRKAIEEGLVDAHHDPRHWGPERELESKQVDANLTSGEILADLLHYDPRDPFTTNHLRRDV